MNRARAIADEIPRLRRYARALVADAAEADDLVQECLLRALNKQRQWKRGRSPRKWLFAILHNLHIDRARQRAKRPPLVDIAMAQAVEQEQTGDPGAALDIEQALQALPLEQRQIVLLVGLEGLSYAETAAVLEVPIGTVMSRLARGRERLRRHLQHDTSRRPPLKRVK